jgi:hypothetical protein
MGLRVGYEKTPLQGAAELTLARDHGELRLVAVSRTATRDLAARSAAASSYTRTRDYQIPSRLATRTPKVTPAKP